MTNVNVKYKANLAKLLKGLTFQKDEKNNIISQVSGNIRICFLAPTEKRFSLDERFDNPTSVSAETVSNFGNIKFTNKSQKEVLIPAGMVYITDKKIQDHGVAKGIYIKGNSTKTTDDNVCVQHSQGGIGSFTDSVLAVLPPTLLEGLYSGINGGRRIDRCWNEISLLNKRNDNGNSEDLVNFKKRFDKILEQNSIYIECPTGSIGYVVFQDDEIVIIDKLPSITMTKQMEKVYIKDRYGAMVFEAERDGKKSKKYITEFYAQLKKEHKNLKTVELLKMANDKYKEFEQKLIVDRFSELLVEQFSIDEDGHEPLAKKLTSDNYVGHIIIESTNGVLDDGLVLSLSLVQKKINLKEVTRKKLASQAIATQQSNFKF